MNAEPCGTSALDKSGRESISLSELKLAALAALGNTIISGSVWCASAESAASCDELLKLNLQRVEFLLLNGCLYTQIHSNVSFFLETLLWQDLRISARALDGFQWQFTQILFQFHYFANAAPKNLGSKIRRVTDAFPKTQLTARDNSPLSSQIHSVLNRSDQPVNR